MKKKMLVFASAACIIAESLSTGVVAQSNKGSRSIAFVIPVSGAGAGPATVAGPLISFDRTVSNLYPQSNIEGINITSVNIESSESPKRDLSMFKSIKIYVCRKDGSNPVLLSSRPKISKNAGSSLFFDAGKKGVWDSNTISASQIDPNWKIEDIVARLPGVTVSGTTASIRGQNTTGTNPYAAFVLDNIMVGNMPAGLNAASIKSVKVLKEPTELAPYGIQGANGIIRIETKKGVDVSAISGTGEDSTVLVRIEYLLREDLKSEAGLNVTLMTATNK